MGLTEEMRAAVEASPPSGIDLDELVQKGRARRVRSRAAMAVAGVAGFVAVALGTVGAYSLTAAPHGNHPASPAGPKPATAHPSVTSSTAHPSVTPSTTLVTIQLNDAVQAFPASMHVPHDVSFAYGGVDAGAPRGYYYTSWQFNHVDYGIQVFVGDGHTPVDKSENGCDPQHRGDPSLGCDRLIERHAVMYTVSNVTTAHTQRTTTVQYSLDGGCSVSVDAVGSGAAQIPSEADIQAAVHVRGLCITD